MVDLVEGGGEVAEVVQHCGQVHAADCDGGMIGAEVAQVGGEGKLNLFAGGLVLAQAAEDDCVR